MTKAILVCTSIFAFVTVVGPALAGEQTAKETHVLRNTSSLPNSTEGDCETRIQKLDASSAEGEERLAEKNEGIDFCVIQYEHDNTIKRLFKARRKVRGP